jgi:hypothetical protein
VLYQLNYWPINPIQTTKNRTPIKGSIFHNSNHLISNDFGNNTRANGTTAFTDREAQTFFHRDRVDQVNVI